MAFQEAKDRIEVTFEDQQRINTFSRLNAKMHDFEAQIKAKKKFLEDLEDLENELMLSDEDSVRFSIGDCFVHVEKDAAEERLQKETEDCHKDVDSIDGQLVVIKEQLKELKGALYSKFKDSINLEE